MSLVRAWRRELLRASMTSLLAPAALIGALAIMALAGDFGQLGALGQLFAGPSLPTATEPASARPARVHHTTVHAGARATLITSRSAGGANLGTGGGASAPAGGGNPGGSPGGRGNLGPGGGTFSGGSTPRHPRTPRPPSPAPTLVDRVVGVGTSVTKQVPGPVGALATNVLVSVGQTIDRVVPHNAPSRALLSGSVQLP